MQWSVPLYLFWLVLISSLFGQILHQNDYLFPGPIWLEYFCLSLTLKCLSLKLRCVSCRWQIGRFCFFIHSVKLWGFLLENWVRWYLMLLLKCVLTVVIMLIFSGGVCFFRGNNYGFLLLSRVSQLYSFLSSVQNINSCFSLKCGLLNTKILSYLYHEILPPPAIIA